MADKNCERKKCNKRRMKGSRWCYNCHGFMMDQMRKTGYFQELDARATHGHELAAMGPPENPRQRGQRL